MNKPLFIFILSFLMLSGSVIGQTFNAAGTPAGIPDPGNVNLSVTVSGLGGTVATDDEVQLNLNIGHVWASDIVVGITPPGGTEILIVNRIGGGVNFDMVSGNTLSFRSNASGIVPTPSTTGVVPAGVYLPTGSAGKPVGSFSSLIGATRDGTWNIRVRDDDAIMAGSVDAASITFFGIAPANTVVTGTVASANAYCPNSSIDIPFTSTGTFNAGNVFTAELSDASGSFAAPTVIGTLALSGTDPSDVIEAVLPGSLIAGTGYRVRVIADAPATTGSDNGTDLTLVSSEPIEATISASNTSVCANTSVTLTASVPSGFTPSEYLWYKDGTPVFYQNGGSGTYTFNVGTNAATNDYSLSVVYSGYSCLSALSASSTVAITVNAPDVTITPNGPTTYCINNPTTLNAVAGYNSYTWKRSTTIVAVATNSFTPTISGNHSVTITDANGCSKTSLWTNVTVRPLPAANAGADKTACLGSTVQIGAANNTANSYAWSPTTGLSNPAISNPMASPTSMTTYTVTVTNNTTGCSKTDGVIVSVSSLPPTPTISKTTSGTNAILSVSSVAATSVNWYRNGTLYLSNKPANGSITVPISSPVYTYTVKSKGANGCLSSFSNFVTARKGDDKDGDLIIALENNLMTAYPNPTTGNLQVEIQNTEIGNGTLYLYNSLGQMMFSQNVELVEGSAKLSFDLTNVAAGVYSLSFEKEVVKVIKE